MRLREETRDAHTRAERSPFMQALMRGTLDRPAYGRFVRDLHVLYSAMEGAVDRNSSHPAIAPLDHPELRRVPPLERDAAFFLGHSWRAVECSDVAGEYARHLDAIVADDPALLVAHHYTRYLGDLSGGQILKKIAAKTLGLPAGEGLEFYVFDGIPDPTLFKHAYRRALDALPVDDAQAGRIVAEACAAFEWSQRLADAALVPKPAIVK